MINNRIGIILVFVLVSLSILALLPGAESGHVDYTLNMGRFLGVSLSEPTGIDNETLSDGGDLIVSYNMETLDGSDMNDFSTNNNDGTIAGSPTFTTGIAGQATRFDGVDNDIESGAIVTPTDHFTVSVWILPDAGADGFIAGFDNGIGRSYIWYGLTADRVTFNFDIGGAYSVTPAIDVLSPFWHHLAYTYNAATTEVRIYYNGTQVHSSTRAGILQTMPDVELGRFNHGGFQYEGLTDEFQFWNRTLNEVEIGWLANVSYPYTFRFDSHDIVPGDVSTGNHYISGLNMTWGANTDNGVRNTTFTANASVWFEGVGVDTERAISWDSFFSETAGDIGFNFTMPTGTYPYWVNNTHQANLSTVADAISFNWTDWLDGEHLFELGIEFTSTPILTGTIDILYSYQTAVTKTSITGWNLTTGPTWASISSGGLITGIPDTPGSHLFVVQSNATGGVTVSQTFTVIVPAIPIPPSLTNTGILFMIGFIPFLLMVGIGFWKEQGAMIIVGGIAGVLLGLWVIFALQDFGNTQFFGVIFVGIGILFSYVGWVNIDRSGGV